MKTIRSISENPILLFWLSVYILLFSCSNETILAKTELSGKDMMRGIYFMDGSAAAYVTPMRDLKLDELFNDEQLQLIRTNVDNLLDQIETKYPGTFQSFKRDITSGDHIRISESLTKYASIVHETTMEVFNEHHLLFSSIQSMDKPLAKLIDSYFPINDREKLSPRAVKEIITSENFNSEVSGYFNDLNEKIGQTGRTEDQMVLIVWFAAVAVVVIYVAAVLAYAAAYAWREVDWGSLSKQRGDRSLLKEQVINAIAVNFIEFK